MFIDDKLLSNVTLVNFNAKSRLIHLKSYYGTIGLIYGGRYRIQAQRKNGQKAS